MSATVSIITICLNDSETIEDTLKSILNQDYRNIEYIVIDGGSKDGTLDVLNKYQSEITKIISESDNGIYDAMNKGLAMADGDIVGFLNADDFYTDNQVISRVVNEMKANDADCCYGDLEYVDRGNEEKTIRTWKSQPYKEGLFEKGWHPPHPTFFVKRAVFDNYGGFDTSFEISADYELMLRLLRRYGVKSCYIPRLLVKMRTGGTSAGSLKQIAKANLECYRAWRKNGLPVSPLIMIRKPLSKLKQLKN